MGATRERAGDESTAERRDVSEEAAAAEGRAPAGKPVGAITDRDVAIRVLAAGGSPDVPVEDVT